MLSKTLLIQLGKVLVVAVLVAVLTVAYSQTIPSVSLPATIWAVFRFGAGFLPGLTRHAVGQVTPNSG